VDAPPPGAKRFRYGIPAVEVLHGS
jgi:hypothetical protein